MKRGDFKKGGRGVYTAFIFALMCALIYLALCTHVLVFVTVQADGGKYAVHTVFRAWGLRVCVDGAGGKMPAKAQAARLWRYRQIVAAAARTLRVGQIDLHARIGLEDAAATAMLCGAVQIAADALIAAAGQVRRSDVRIEADYREKALVLSGRCIFSAIPGDIMFAAAKAAVKKTQREGFKWLSTPSRA